jgi:hypothetical protein
MDTGEHGTLTDPGALGAGVYLDGEHDEPALTATLLGLLIEITEREQSPACAGAYL